MTAAHQQRVNAYYDGHPINEEQILGALAERGIASATASEDDLVAFDQDHYGGAAATERLAALAGITASQRVLDVCSGMGGPARLLAHRLGCTVVGLDFTASRVAGARRLTEMVKLHALVSSTQGDAMAMPFGAAEFDAAIGQEAWCHVPQRRR